jgi:hypothetical protein
LQRREIEFTACGFGTYTNLLPYIDYSYPYAFNKLHALQKFPDMYFYGFATITNPFSLGVWLALSFAFIAFSVFYVVGMNSPGNNSQDIQAVRKIKESSQALYWAKTMPFLLFADTLRQMPESMSKRVESYSFRIIATTWGVASTITGIMYSTVLFSALFNPAFEEYIDTTEQYVLHAGTSVLIVLTCTIYLQETKQSLNVILLSKRDKYAPLKRLVKMRVCNINIGAVRESLKGCYKEPVRGSLCESL